MSGKLIDLIPWLHSARDTETAAEADAEAEDTDVEATGQETGTENTTTIDELVEQVRARLVGEMSAQLVPVVEAIQQLDGYIRTHDEALQHLVQSDAAKVKDALDGGSWFKDLYVRSRDEEAATPPEDEPQLGGTYSMQAGETPSSLIFGQDKRG